ncbi:COG6-domain-containing protein [Coemansia reversa NRRL 1564]|uniref:COG6-domain-containing protein n=1 Tax=Coemansia reversa (strain ATCC 12441 / NRRL 1564) TaxID=763665 RepID=A0A2G5B7M5_COERN|nr:COG6-domain-containing protein [Coemansia reversa NRRL 1564]|eukprot:PIA15018.1 COG6-domain-containing protein [Coemansia reversa NRRL 1564]
MVRQKLANTFATRYSLTEREIEILGNDIKLPLVNDEYFLALDRVGKARSECQKLLSVKKQTAADDLLSELTRQEEKAFNALLRWILSNIRVLNRNNTFKLLGRALNRLHPHQALFDVAIAELGRIRSEIVAGDFINALVRGGPQGIPRPIESHAADPLRYVSDILAWLHQTCASERELLELLFSEIDSRASLVSQTLSGVARPLEIRIRQTLATINDPIIIYNIHSILSFYTRLLVGALKDNSSVICKTIEDLANDSRTLLQSQLDTMVEYAINQLDIAAMSPALRVPETFHSLLAAVAEICRQYYTSHTKEDADFDRTIGLPPITKNIVELLENLLKDTHTVIEKSIKLHPYEQTMLELNVYWATKQEVFVAGVRNLEHFPESNELTEQKLADQLIKQLLEVVKLKSKLPFEGIEQMSLPLLRNCLESFNLNLRNTLQDLDVSRMVSRLDNHMLARNITTKVSQLFVEDYNTLFNYINKGIHSDVLQDILLSPQTVSTLL